MVLLYGMLKRVLTRGVFRLITDFFNIISRVLEIRKTTSTLCHLQTNGQRDYYNRTIGRLRYYVVEHLRDWNDTCRPWRTHTTCRYIGQQAYLCFHFRWQDTLLAWLLQRHPVPMGSSTIGRQRIARSRFEWTSIGGLRRYSNEPTQHWRWSKSRTGSITTDLLTNVLCTEWTTSFTSKGNLYSPWQLEQLKKYSRNLNCHRYQVAIQSRKCHSE